MYHVVFEIIFFNSLWEYGSLPYVYDTKKNTECFFFFLDFFFFIIIIFFFWGGGGGMKKCKLPFF